MINNDEPMSESEGKELSFRVIAHIRSPFRTKFGIPRQSGYCDNVKSYIEFVPEFANPDALRGIGDFSHLWILWYFSEVENGREWSPTVRPPKLGGNKRVGVFATRSPFRPNPIGLSSVMLIGVEENGGKLRIAVTGADLMDGTPILDIKPYLAYTDSHPEASGGISVNFAERKLAVHFSEEADECGVPEETVCGLAEILEQDPRPAYHDDPDRIYGLVYSDIEVKFRVDDKSEILTVLSMEKCK